MTYFGNWSSILLHKQAKYNHEGTSWLVYSNVINVPMIFTLHVFLLARHIYGVLINITLTCVCTCAYLHKFLIKLQLINSHCKCNHGSFSLFFPNFDCSGKFFTISILMENFFTELDFVENFSMRRCNG